MPTEEQTYRTNVTKTLDRIETKLDYTNGKVRRLTIALVGIGFFCVGLGLQQLGPLLMLLL